MARRSRGPTKPKDDKIYFEGEVTEALPNTMFRVQADNGLQVLAIGAVLRQRGLLGDGSGQYEPSMQGIMRYIREHPEEGRELMNLNKSWVFFRELTTDGTLGALDVPVRGGSSVATDPNFVPLGAPVWLMLDRTEASGLWIASRPSS